LRGFNSLYYCLHLKYKTCLFAFYLLKITKIKFLYHGLPRTGSNWILYVYMRSSRVNSSWVGSSRVDSSQGQFIAGRFIARSIHRRVIWTENLIETWNFLSVHTKLGSFCCKNFFVATGKLVLVKSTWLKCIIFGLNMKTGFI
jgi:hypothetical protein